MLKIEEGKFYRARNGEKIGPMIHKPDTAVYPWCAYDSYGAGSFYTEYGNFYSDRRLSDHDLISEWVDAVDLTKITTPFGLLDEATQKALKAHGGPIEKFTSDFGWENDKTPHWFGGLTYRVRPEPPKPREYWINIYRDGSALAHPTRAIAKDHNDGSAQIIHVREVL